MKTVTESRPLLDPNSINCDLCKATEHEFIWEEAFCYCPECEAFICPRCQITHRSLRWTRDHECVPLEEGLSLLFDPFRFCPRHPKNLVSRCCRSDKSGGPVYEALCGECCLDDEKIGYTTHPLKDGISIILADLEQQSVVLKTRIFEISICMEGLQQIREAIYKLKEAIKIERERSNEISLIDPESEWRLQKLEDFKNAQLKIYNQKISELQFNSTEMIYHVASANMAQQEGVSPVWLLTGGSILANRMRAWISVGDEAYQIVSLDSGSLPIPGDTTENKERSPPVQPRQRANKRNNKKGGNKPAGAKDVQMLEAIRNRNFEMVKDLSVDPAIKTLDLFFRDAVIKGSPQIVRYFLDFTNQQIDCNYGAGDRDTALYLAVACGRNDIVEMLVADDRIDVNRVSGRGRTPLWMAAYSGHIVITRTLLAHKDIQVNKVNENGDTPLHAACAHGKKVAAEMLMNDPRVNPELKNRAGLTAYQCATRRRIRHKKLEEMMLTQRN